MGTLLVPRRVQYVYQVYIGVSVLCTVGYSKTFSALLRRMSVLCTVGYSKTFSDLLRRRNVRTLVGSFLSHLELGQKI